MNSLKQSLQDQFLDTLCKGKKPTTVFLLNGIKLQGVITGFDNFSLTLQREAHAQLIYKHAISTIMPNAAISITEPPLENDLA